VVGSTNYTERIVVLTFFATKSARTYIHSIATFASLPYVRRLHCTTVTVILIYLFSYVNAVIAEHENFKYSTWRFEYFICVQTVWTCMV
jgi:hypothetical protein